MYGLLSYKECLLGAYILYNKAGGDLANACFAVAGSYQQWGFWGTFFAILVFALLALVRYLYRCGLVQPLEVLTIILIKRE